MFILGIEELLAMITEQILVLWMKVINKVYWSLDISWLFLKKGFHGKAYRDTYSTGPFT